MDVWLVDDDSIERILVAGLLLRFSRSHQLSYFSTAEAALAVLEGVTLESVPDLILLDLSMPGLNGFDFLDRYQALGVSQKYPQTELYILTSSHNPQDRDNALAYDCVKGYILKPLLMTQLKQILLQRDAEQ
jgi:CheY-like chemotaxis protein